MKMMTKKIRKLNNNGLKEFAAFLIDSHDELVSENNPPTQLLYDDQYSEDLNVIKNIKTFSFSGRFDIGKHYFNELSQSLTDEEINEQGLWAWLSLYHWDDINPNRANATINRLEHYIPFGNQKNFINNDLLTRVLGAEKGLGTTPLEYRHSIKCFYNLYERFKDDALILQSKGDPLGALGDIMESYFSKKWVSEYDVIFFTMKDVFWNNSSFVKPNGKAATETSKSSPGYMGGLRRYFVVIEYVMTIYDLSVMKKSRLRKELGAEFK